MTYDDDWKIVILYKQCFSSIMNRDALLIFGRVFLTAMLRFDAIFIIPFNLFTNTRVGGGFKHHLALMRRHSDA